MPGTGPKTPVPSPHAAVSHVCTPHVGHRVAIRAACSRAENTTAGMADTTVAHGSVHSLGSDAGLGDTTHGGDGGGGDSVASLRAVCRQFGIAENVRCPVAACVRMLFTDQSLALAFPCLPFPTLPLPTLPYPSLPFPCRRCLWFQAETCCTPLPFQGPRSMLASRRQQNAAPGQMPMEGGDTTAT